LREWGGPAGGLKAEPFLVRDLIDPFGLVAVTLRHGD